MRQRLQAPDYDAERTEIALRNSRWALIAGLVVNPLFLLVDWGAGIWQGAPILIARGQAELVMAVCLAIMLLRQPGQKAFYVLGFSCVLSLAVMVSYLRHLAAVEVGSYDWGLSLILLCLVLFYPLKVVEYLALALPAAAIYAVGILASESSLVGQLSSFAALGTPLVIGVIAAILLEANRQRAYRYRDRVNLLNTKLAEFNERLEKSQEQMSRFVAVCSHDIKNRLAAVSNAAELLKKYGSQMEEPKRVSYLDTIDEETAAMGRLARDFLDLAALDAGAIRLEREPCLLGDIARSVQRTADLVASNQGVIVEVEVEEGLPTVDGDPDRLAQVIDNLVANAVRHSPEKGVVRIAVRRLPEGGQAIEVSDEGEGVPEEERARIFERFATGRTKGAAGLGLAIVSELVSLHGGGIEVGGSAGQGATFRILLPGAS